MKYILLNTQLTHIHDRYTDDSDIDRQQRALHVVGNMIIDTKVILIGSCCQTFYIYQLWTEQNSIRVAYNYSGNSWDDLGKSWDYNDTVNCSFEAIQRNQRVRIPSSEVCQIRILHTNWLKTAA